jgi:tRNA(Ile)-lysidine synthase
MADADLPNQLAAAWPPERWRHTTVLVAVSGGADSVALLRALDSITRADGDTRAESVATSHGRPRLVVAHYNHGLRGAEADADERFVVALADKLGLECRIGRGDVRRQADEAGDGIEAAARNERYAFFRAEAETLGARYVATAHTADDQAETILHRLVRGTGIAGLRGMSRARPLGSAVSLIRPLLTFRREQLTAYLAAIGQAYRIDGTNYDRRFTRNRLRHELLPLLAEQYNPRIVEALVRLGQLAGDAQQVIDEALGDLPSRAIRTESDGTVVIDLASLRDLSPFLVRELLIAVWKQRGWPLQRHGYREWDALAEMISSSAAKTTLPSGVTAQVMNGCLRLMQ